MKSSSYAVLAVSLLALTLTALSASARGDGPARRYPSEVHTERTKPFFRHRRGRRSRALSSALGDRIRPTGISARQLPCRTSGIGPGPRTFLGQGHMKLMFDRIGMPNGDMPLDAKVIATRGYKVDKDGDIRGKGTPSATSSNGCCRRFGRGRSSCRRPRAASHAEGREPTHTAPDG